MSECLAPTVEFVPGLTVPRSFAPLSMIERTGVSTESNLLGSKSANVASWFFNALSFSLPVDMEFQIQASEWKRDTMFFSSPPQAAAHPAYQRIIGMGPNAVPFILREMQHEPGLWFDALMAITGDQPVPEEHAGDIHAMTEDWLDWGRRHGIV